MHLRSTLAAMIAFGSACSGPLCAQDAWLDTTFSQNGFTWQGFSTMYDGNKRVTYNPNTYKIYGLSYMEGPAQFSIHLVQWNGGGDYSFSPDARIDGTFAPGVGSWPGGIVVDDDGRIIVGGYMSTAVGLAAYLPNGSMDATFGVNGTVVTSLGSQSMSHYCNDLVLDANNKLVLAGGYYGDVLLARYDLTGALDTTFGDSGIVLLPYDAIAESVIIMGDGRLVVVGRSYAAPISAQMVVRLTPDGELDPSFNGTGVVLLDIDTADTPEIAYDAVVQPDGKIVVVGLLDPGWPEEPRATLYRLDANGQLDMGFGGGVHIFPGYDAVCYTVLMDDHDRILVGGGLESDAALWRFNPDGSLDSTFCTQGVLREGLPGTSMSAYDMCYLPDGRILMGGGIYGGTSLDGIVARYGLCGIDPEVAITGATLTAMATGTGLSYQWIDCSNGTAIIGATAPTYTPGANGNYAVAVSSSACVDTSACSLITTIGVPEQEHGSDVHVTPALVEHDRLFIHLPPQERIRKIEIITALGTLAKYVDTPASTSGGTMVIDVSDLAPGHYMVRVSGATRPSIARFAIQR